MTPEEIQAVIEAYNAGTIDQQAMLTVMQSLTPAEIAAWNASRLPTTAAEAAKYNASRLSGAASGAASGFTGAVSGTVNAATSGLRARSASARPPVSAPTPTQNPQPTVGFPTPQSDPEPSGASGAKETARRLLGAGLIIPAASISGIKGLFGGGGQPLSEDGIPGDTTPPATPQEAPISEEAKRLDEVAPGSDLYLGKGPQNTDLFAVGNSVWQYAPDGTLLSTDFEEGAAGAQVRGADTLTVGGRVMQWNPDTGRYDIDVGSAGGGGSAPRQAKEIIRDARNRPVLVDPNTGTMRYLDTGEDLGPDAFAALPSQITSAITGNLLLVDPATGAITDTGQQIAQPTLSPQEAQAYALELQDTADDAAMGRQNAADAAAFARTTAQETGESERTRVKEVGLDRRQELAARTTGFQSINTLAPQLGELAIKNAQFTKDTLSTPADYLARAFLTAGKTSPLPQVSQADVINQLRQNIGGFQGAISEYRGFSPTLTQAPQAQQVQEDAPSNTWMPGSIGFGTNLSPQEVADLAAKNSRQASTQVENFRYDYPGAVPGFASGTLGISSLGQNRTYQGQPLDPTFSGANSNGQYFRTLGGQLVWENQLDPPQAAGFGAPQLPTFGNVTQQGLQDLERSVRPPRIASILEGQQPSQFQLPFNVPTPQQYGGLNAEDREAFGTTLATQYNLAPSDVESAIAQRYSTGNKRTAGTAGFAAGGFTTEPVFLGNEEGPELFINPTGAPIQIVDHKTTKKMGVKGFAHGTVKSRKQAGFMLSAGSPLSNDQKAKLRRELHRKEVEAK